MTYTLGFSPCPNDTFIFDAMVNKKIDTCGFDFTVALQDVQTLNEWATQGKLDISKISYGVLPLVLHQYRVLNAGGALGKGVGPLLIARTAMPLDALRTATIAIPGRNTTAHMLFSLAFPDAVHKRFMLFSDIEQAVINGTVDAGVIIHENRFTYRQKGLIKLLDLGEYWEQETQSPIPLGGIVTRKSYRPDLQLQLDDIIRRSLEYAFSHYPVLTEYVKQHAQEMEEAVMRQHIDLYVNNYSIALQDDGKAAVKKLLDVYGQVNKVAIPDEDVFVM